MKLFYKRKETNTVLDCIIFGFDSIECVDEILESRNTITDAYVRVVAERLNSPDGEIKTRFVNKVCDITRSHNGKYYFNCDGDSYDVFDFIVKSPDEIVKGLQRIDPAHTESRITFSDLLTTIFKCGQDAIEVSVDVDFYCSLKNISRINNECEYDKLSDDFAFSVKSVPMVNPMLATYITLVPKKRRQGKYCLTALTFLGTDFITLCRVCGTMKVHIACSNSNLV